MKDQAALNAEGWLWPVGDELTWPIVRGELAEIPDLVSLCRRKRTCIQAGGNGGLWVEKLAQQFERVYTFEPDCLNFRCLVHNVPFENVVFTQAAVGERQGWIEVDRWCGARNPGANRVHPQRRGHIPQVAIDSFCFSDVDLIQLDIEGLELQALKGAERTIARCRPVISVELRNHAGTYGTTDDEIRGWLVGRGYVFRRRMNCDEFFIPTE